MQYRYEIQNIVPEEHILQFGALILFVFYNFSNFLFILLHHGPNSSMNPLHSPIFDSIRDLLLKLEVVLICQNFVEYFLGVIFHNRIHYRYIDLTCQILFLVRWYILVGMQFYVMFSH